LEITDEIEKSDADCENGMPEMAYDESYAPPRKVRPELILTVIALLSAVILALTVVICLPHIRAELEERSQPPPPRKRCRFWKVWKGRTKTPKP